MNVSSITLPTATATPAVTVIPAQPGWYVVGPVIDLDTNDDEIREL
jgi:hypothetical protein